MNLELVLDRTNRYRDTKILSVPKLLEFTWLGMDVTCRYKKIDATTSNLQFSVKIGRMPYSIENPQARTQLFKLSRSLIAGGEGRLNFNIEDGQVYFESWSKVGLFDNSADVIIETTIAILKYRELLFEVRPLTIRNDLIRKMN